MIHTTQECRIGDNVELMREMESETFDMIITSPPYWGLRDYGVDGQIGLEPTLGEYHGRLLEVTAECMRVLKPTGVMFWNHGDSYGGSGGSGGDYAEGGLREGQPKVGRAGGAAKCMSMQNERLIIKMIDDQGWILRNRIIWNKPNGMPSSVTDRFSNKYEPVYMLVKSNDTNYYYNTKTGHMQRDKPPGTKGEEGVDWDWKDVGSDYSVSDTKIRADDAENLASPRARVHREKKVKKVSNWVGRDYWFDLDAVRVPHKEPERSGTKENMACRRQGGRTVWSEWKADHRIYNPIGKNPGDVWTIPTQPYPESHFATFPTALIEPMIKAACPAEICPVCGLARERIVETETFITRPTTGRDTQKQKQHPENSAGLARTGGHVAAKHTTIGWTSCDCNSGWIAGTVLDPFTGSGTVLEVCRLLNRNAIGMELNPEYESLIKERSMSHTPPLTAY